MTLKSLSLFFVSLFFLAEVGAQAQPAAPASPRAPEAPAAFTFFFEGGSFLGVHSEDINKENMSRYGLNREPRGVGITKVVEGSPAERAGLRTGDVIIKFDNEPVTSVRKLNRLISEVAPEHSVRLGISRGGDEKDLTVTLGKRSDFQSSTTVPGQRWEDLYNLKGNQEGLDRLRDFKFDDKNNFSFVFGNNRRIGVTTTQLTKQLADFFGVSSGKGLLITSVREESPAMKAGLRAGDVITEADNSAIESVTDLMRALNRSKDESEITLTIMRDKSQRTIRLKPERGRDSNSVVPGLYYTPQAMQIELPELPKIVVPVMPQVQLPVLPKVVVPDVRVLAPVRTLTLPSAPL